MDNRIKEFFEEKDEMQVKMSLLQKVSALYSNIVSPKKHAEHELRKLLAWGEAFAIVGVKKRNNKEVLLQTVMIVDPANKAQLCKLAIKAIEQAHQEALDGEK